MYTYTYKYISIISYAYDLCYDLVNYIKDIGNISLSIPMKFYQNYIPTVISIIIIYNIVFGDKIHKLYKTMLYIFMIEYISKKTLINSYKKPQEIYHVALWILYQKRLPLLHQTDVINIPVIIC